jgi:hypothetical protein
MKNQYSDRKRITYPISAGVAGATLLMFVYFGIVTWAESPQHALEFFWQDRWIVLPIILGFGVQAALYTILKLRLFEPRKDMSLRENMTTSPVPGASVGASGTTSTIAMAACCVHHVTDVLPILGLTAAATFLANYRLTFMFVGLGMTLLGIGYMLFILLHERKKAMQISSLPLFISMENS